MTSKELSQIKKYQREFKKQFNKDLIIDIVAMNGVVIVSNSAIKQNFNKTEADKILNRLCKEHEADLNKIKDRKERLAFKYPNEVRVIANYVNECLKRKWGMNEIMVNINRERTDGYYYIRKFKV